jgi:hypothetical protein
MAVAALVQGIDVDFGRELGDNNSTAAIGAVAAAVQPRPH